VNVHVQAALLPSTPTAYRRIEIANALRRLCLESELYWNAMSVAEFVSPIGGAWSPADNVRHLTKSIQPITRAMRMPKVVLRLMFGTSSRVSRGYREMVTLYHAALREGGQAGRFSPSPGTDAGDPAGYRRQVLSRHRDAVEALAVEVTAWPHHHIDTLRLPHPLLGRLTVREMLLWTLYHNLHHVQVVARRRGEYFSDESPLNA
jgi:hypothetical protein